MFESVERNRIYDDSLLTVVAESEPPELRLVLAGELDASNAAVSAIAEAHVGRELDESARTQYVIVDMHDVTFCGSEGLLWLLALEEFVRRRGRQMRVRNPSATVARLLDLVCLTRLTDGVADGERPRR